MKGGRFWSRLRRVIFGLALFALVFESVSTALLPVAYAQTNTQTKICTPENTLLVTTASVSTAFVAPYSSGLNLFDVGTKITASTTLGVGLTRVEALIYRATTTADTWSKVGTVALSNQGQISNTWTGEYTGGLPDGAYRLFALVKGYSKVNSTETLKTQGCSIPQTVTKGKSESAKFCEGATTAKEVGFTTSIAVKKGGNAAKGEAAVFGLTITLQKGLRNATQPQISVKRALEGATHVFTTIQADVPLGTSTDVDASQKAWKPEVSDKPSSAGEYRYYVLGEVTVNGKKYTTCGNVFNRWGNPDNSVKDEDVSLETLRKWFAADNVNPYTIVVPKEEGKKPYVLVGGDEESGRPDIIFELAYIFGNGGSALQTVSDPIGTLQRDFTMFEAFAMRLDSNNNRVKTRLKGVFYMHEDDDLEGQVEYWENESDAVTRRSDPEKLQNSWDVTKESYTDLYARLYDVPKDPSSDNCLDKDGITKIGPAGKGADAEISDRGYETAKLNGNCINAQDYGWAAHWGVKVTSIPLELGKSCSVQGFLSLFSEGIGVMIAKMLGCLASELFTAIVNTVQPLLCEAASRSMLTSPASAADTAPQDCESIKNESPVQGSIQPPSLTSFFVGTAHAQNITGSHKFEEELKKPNSVIVRIWGYSRSLLNIIVVAALLAIAFANIFHFNINTYAAKKMLPGLVIGVVAANGSLLIIRFLADVTQAVSQLAVDVSGSNGTITALIAWHFPKAIGEAAIVGAIGSFVAATGLAFFTGGFSLLAWIILVIVLICYYSFLVIAFAVTFIKRVVMLYFLSMVAPLAFVAYGVPQFQKYFFQWWDMFLRQLFVFPIVLFGMSATVALASQLNAGDYANVLNPNNFISGLVSIILVMSAATMVLKLPKLFTKGALDVAATLKKVLGAAPRTIQGVQGAHKFVAGGGFQKLRGNLATISANNRWTSETRRKALKDQAAAHFASARNKRLEYEDKSKARKFLGKAVGWSTLFAEPEILQGSIQEKYERLAKDRKIAALTKTSRLPGKLRGATAEAPIARKLAQEEIRDTGGGRYGLLNWANGLGGGHLEAVYDTKGKNPEQNLMLYMWEAAKRDPKVFEALRQRFGTINSEDGMIEFIEKPRNEDDPLAGGLGIANRWDIHDLMKVAGFEGENTAAARQVKATEAGVEKSDDFLTQARKRRTKIDPIKKVRPDYDPATDDDGGGGGTDDDDDESAFAGGTAQNARDIDQSIQARVKEVLDHSLVINPSVADDFQEKLIKNIDTLTDLKEMNPYDSMYTGALEQTKQTLIDAITGSTGEIADQLRAEIQQTTDPARLTELSENISLALAARSQGGDMRESVASVVAQASQGTREFHQAHNELMSQTDLSKLEQAITSSLQAGGQDMADVLSRELGAGIDKMSKTLGKQLDPETQRKMFQQMAAQIQGTMVGPGQKTLRAVLQSSLQSLPKTFAKVVGVHTLQPKAMEVRVVNQSAAQPSAEVPPPTPPTPPTS